MLTLRKLDVCKCCVNGLANQSWTGFVWESREASRSVFTGGTGPRYADEADARRAARQPHHRIKSVTAKVCKAHDAGVAGWGPNGTAIQGRSLQGAKHILPAQRAHQRSGRRPLEIPDLCRL